MSRFTAVCGCLGCKRDATTVVIHDEHGQRAVCDHHARDQEVIAE
ncbi:hypothetical protein [Natronomonas halophila]|nr:hypothetical protein [Natronomonas halophila]